MKEEAKSNYCNKGMWTEIRKICRTINRFSECLGLGKVGVYRAIYSHRNKIIYLAIVDMEKAFDRVPRKTLWQCLQKRNVNDIN